MLTTESSLGFIPIGTKIYLKNKQLINVEKLKFGDEVLSIKILNNNTKNSFDTHCEYLMPQNNKTIDLKNIEISSSYITNIEFSGYSNKNIYIINNSDYIDKKQVMLTMQVIGDNKVIKAKNIDTLHLFSNKEDEYCVSLEKDIKTDTKDFILFNNKIESCTLASDNIPLFSMSLFNNEFYLTENLILLGRSI